MKEPNDLNDPRGSIWRKWDLHVHTPDTKLNDNYKTIDDNDKWDKFCDIIENSDVEVFGLTDYFSAKNYFSFKKKFYSKFPDSQKKFFLNIEFRLNESVNQSQEEVNFHLIFNPSSENKVNKFLSVLKVVKTNQDEAPIVCSELKTEDDFMSATVTRENIAIAFEETFGKKSNRLDHFIIFTAANNDGIRPSRGKKRKEIITDQIDKFSDSFFGGIQNVDYYLKTDRLEDPDHFIKAKPVISGSDPHSFEELTEWLGNRIIESKKGHILKDVTWVKTDKTYEGLKQILYEPEPGERVKIGPLKPDSKDDYKVIKKILFDHTDFPKEIYFNGNLCSIIGSRSSGKSALLAYIAHSVDKETTEKLIKGPGEGNKYHWDKITLSHKIVWTNGKSNDERPGKVVYIPQGHLFTKSKDANDIKDKIEPVLFMHLPEFKSQYFKTTNIIDTKNDLIKEEVANWFKLSKTIDKYEGSLKNYGNRNSIEEDIKQIDDNINELKTKFQLSDGDIEKYQTISSEILDLQINIASIGEQLSQLSEISESNHFFNSLKISLTPSPDNLPTDLQGKIASILENEEGQILGNINKEILNYKQFIENEKQISESNVKTINDKNSTLIEKNQKNIELETHVKKKNKHNQNIKEIEKLERKIKISIKNKQSCETDIETLIDERRSIIENLKIFIDESDQSMIEGILFDVEYEIGDRIKGVTQLINTRGNTEFVYNGSVRINPIRKNPGDFLSNIYSGTQKIIAHKDPMDVAQRCLTLTEKILFTAEMENDKIGGFSEPTMTPGKRALFTLRLILAESKDTWPLLIDQPEDDLDSRSIYDEVVPFLKDKKKERQIIMVTHNANLVVGSDSEEIIVANRNGDDRQNEDGKQFNYLSGSIEFSCPNDKNCFDTLNSQGVREHACDILDGGVTAFEQRRKKYNLKG